MHGTVQQLVLLPALLHALTEGDLAPTGSF